jgi:hypothetical protein
VRLLVRAASATPAARRWRLRAATDAAPASLRLRASPRSRAAAGEPGGGLKPELRAAIDKFVTSNKVVLFMKGNKQFPQARGRRDVAQP